MPKRIPKNPSMSLINRIRTLFESQVKNILSDKFIRQNLNTMLIKTPDLIEAMIELACSRRWLQTTIFVIEFSQHVIQGLWVKDNSLRQVNRFELLLKRKARDAALAQILRATFTDSTCGLACLCLCVCAVEDVGRLLYRRE